MHCPTSFAELSKFLAKPPFHHFLRVLAYRYASEARVVALCASRITSFPLWLLAGGSKGSFLVRAPTWLETVHRGTSLVQLHLGLGLDADTELTRLEESKRRILSLVLDHYWDQEDGMLRWCCSSVWTGIVTSRDASFAAIDATFVVVLVVIFVEV